MEQTTENKMGVMPVNKLVVTMSLPIVISMLVQALYNIVDSIFVARFSDNAFTAVSLAFPIQTLIIATAVGTGTGINSLISRKLGEKDFETANQTADNGIFLGFLSAVVFAIFGIFFSEAFFKLFTDNKEIIDMGKSYISICTILSFGVFTQITAERILQATGNTLYNMIIQIIGALINIILDPILIFGLLGLPRLGITGAAIATVTGQIIAMILSIYVLLHKTKEVTISFKNFKPNGSIIKQIYIVGIPSIIMQSLSSIMTIGMNMILYPLSDVAVSVLGAYFKLQSFVFMPVFGLTNGIIPIVAYNYGAKNKKRITKAIKIGLCYSVGIMFIGTLLFQFIPNTLLRLFNANDAMIQIGVPALRIISISFVFAGVAIVLSAVFQAIGNGLLSLIMSLIRQLVILLPTAYVLSILVGIHGVWFAFPIAEILAIFIAIIFMQYVHNKYMKPLDAM